MITDIRGKVLKNIMGHKNLNLDRTSLNDEDTIYDERVFEDEETGEQYTGKDFRGTRGQSIGKRSEFDVTKNLRVGEIGLWEMRPNEYSKMNHITNIAKFRRIK